MTTEREEWKPKGAWHVVNGHDGLVADVYGSAENVRRIAAVPDMEAALLEVYTALNEGTLDRDGASEVIERALRKGGRLP